MFRISYTEKEVTSRDDLSRSCWSNCEIPVVNFYIETQCGNRLGQDVIDMKGFSPASSSSVLIVSLKWYDFNIEHFSWPTYFRVRLLCTTWGRAEWFFWSPGKPSNPRIHPLICSCWWLWWWQWVYQNSKIISTLKILPKVAALCIEWNDILEWSGSFSKPRE